MTSDGGTPPLPPRHRPGFIGLHRRRGWELHPGVRAGSELTRRERAADWLGDRIGSWTFVVAAGVVLGVVLVVAVRPGVHDGPVAVLGVVVAGLVLLDLSVVLMVVRRADRSAAELALQRLEATRRAAAELRDLGDQLDRMSVELGRLTARVRSGLDLAAGERP